MNEVIGERELVAESEGGNRSRVIVRIGTPRPAPHNSWVCASGVDGLPGGPDESHGTDSLQALLLAIKDVKGQLARFEKAGGKFYWPGDEESGAMSVAELFGDPN